MRLLHRQAGDRRSRFWADDCGAAIVEFTLLMPLLLIIIFGVVELGSAWYSKQMLVNASREGARLGVLHTEDGISNDDVVAHVAGVLQDSSYPSDFSVDANGADGPAGTQVRVVVSSVYQFPVLSRLVPGVLDSITLSATTVMRHE